jgi:c-di-GMP-binding flagellar brake protein YcgR
MTELSDEIQKLAFISRREYERVPFAKKLTVLDLNSGNTYEANGIDISVKGIGFYSKKLLQKDHHISIQVWLDDVSQKDPVCLTGAVKWSKLEQDGAIIGVQFDALIKPSQHPKLYEMIFKAMRMLLMGAGLL